MKRSVLLIAVYESLRELRVQILARSGFNAHAAANVIEAETLIKAQRYDALLIAADITRPAAEYLVRLYRERNQHGKVIMLGPYSPAAFLADIVVERADPESVLQSLGLPGAAAAD